MKALASFIRATGQAGLFTLAVLRASLPTRDFLADALR